MSPYRPLSIVSPDGDRRVGSCRPGNSIPDAAWLLVAVDLPLLDRATLGVLTEGRSRQHLATAFRHPDGPLEPLCTIWEPAARPVLERRLERGDASLRRLLEAGPVHELEPPAPRAHSQCGFARGSKSSSAKVAGAARVIVSAAHFRAARSGSLSLVQEVHTE